MSNSANQDVMERIRLQVMWDRLLSVVEEQAQTLVRTAFSTSTREAGDVSAGVFDLVDQTDQPFLIKEHDRKFQWGCSHATGWRRRRQSTQAR